MVNKNLPNIYQQLLGHSDWFSEIDPIWKPRVDIYRKDNGWLIKLELAGVRQTDIKLTRLDRLLKVEGKRRDLVVAENMKAYAMEITYNHFERSIELPDSLEGSVIKTEFNQGMLLIQVLCKHNE
jgi:HSP20 family protein